MNMKNEKWETKNEEWKTKDEKWKMKKMGNANELLTFFLNPLFFARNTQKHGGYVWPTHGNNEVDFST